MCGKPYKRSSCRSRIFYGNCRQHSRRIPAGYRSYLLSKYFICRKEYPSKYQDRWRSNFYISRKTCCRIWNKPASVLYDRKVYFLARFNSSLNDQDSKRFFDDYVSTDASKFNNAWLIDLNNKYGKNNQKKAIYRSLSQPIQSFPSELAQAEFLVFRDVKYFSSTAVLVTIVECYPMLGRTWASFYSGKWTGWVQIK